MVSLSEFLHGVQLNAHRVTKYEWGEDGSKVTGQREEVRYENGQKVTYIITERPCDCIGLIIGGLELAGGKWTGTHGTNWTVRNAIDGLSYISSADQLFLGEIVFKAREPGDGGYDLPSSYSDSPDQRDYYHVGVVTQIFPLEITHCTNVGGGIKRDASLGAWHYGGELKYVDYNTGEDAPEPEQSPLYQAIVTAPTGSTVNLRKGPSTNNTILEKVPIGSTVDVLEHGGTWCKVQHGAIIGHMMTEFLRRADENPEKEPEKEPEYPSDTVTKEEIRNAYASALRIAETLKKLLEDDAK